jgi:dihydropteroate synthase
LQAAQKTGLPVCLMHMQGDPETMQLDPHYQNLIEDVKDFFAERIQACEQAGLAKERLILDPGFGFGKSPTDNLTLINRLAEFKSFELPILVGLSRKSTMSKLLEQQNFNPSQQEADIIEASVAGALLAIERGASIVRVHDVKQTVIALKVRQAIKLESVF